MSEQRDYSVLLAVVAGVAVGAGLAIYFAPKTAKLRKQIAGTVSDLAERASDTYDEAVDAVTGAVVDMTKRGNQIRNDAANAVAHSAHEVERMAKAARTTNRG